MKIEPGQVYEVTEASGSYLEKYVGVGSVFVIKCANCHQDGGPVGWDIITISGESDVAYENEIRNCKLVE